MDPAALLEAVAPGSDSPLTREQFVQAVTAWAEKYSAGSTSAVLVAKVELGDEGETRYVLAHAEGQGGTLGDSPES